MIPQPQRIQLLPGALHLPGSLAFYTGPDEPFLAEQVALLAGQVTGSSLTRVEDPAAAQIRFQKTPELADQREAYRLVVDPQGVTVSAGRSAGLFWGLQSLRQLLFEHRGSDGITLPCLVIDDSPRFAYRGCMLDVSRHFFDISVVKHCIDLAALHKLNTFHWHLTDDQGWRVEIQAYPALTRVAANRRETRGDGQPHGGFYTQPQIREVVHYAAERHITVIPEVDFPGHFTAAIAAYPQLGCSGAPVEVRTTFGISSQLACPGKDFTYRFLETVFDELCDLFPGRYFHLGGDEAPKGHWRVCPHCRALMQREGYTRVGQLQSHLMNHIARRIRLRGKTAIAWNDAFRNPGLDSEIMMQYWMEVRGGHTAVDAINAGTHAVISDFYHYYLDYPFGMTPLRKTYAFDPALLPGINPAAAGNITGIEGPLWTEFIETPAQVDAHVYPRLAALAETAWTSAAQKDYAGFERRLRALEPLTAMLGIQATPLEETNPTGWPARQEVMRHFRKALDWEMLKAALATFRPGQEE